MLSENLEICYLSVSQRRGALTNYAPHLRTSQDQHNPINARIKSTNISEYANSKQYYEIGQLILGEQGVDICTNHVLR